MYYRKKYVFPTIDFYNDSWYICKLVMYKEKRRRCGDEKNLFFKSFLVARKPQHNFIKDLF